MEEKKKKAYNIKGSYRGPKAIFNYRRIDWGDSKEEFDKLEKEKKEKEEKEEEYLRSMKADMSWRFKDKENITTKEGQNGETQTDSDGKGESGSD